MRSHLLKPTLEEEVVLILLAVAQKQKKLPDCDKSLADLDKSNRVDETVNQPEQRCYQPGAITSAFLGANTGVLPLLQKIAANLPGMIFQFLQRQDGSQCILYASSGCQELYELEPEVVQADFQVLYRLAHPEDVKTFAESVAVSAATGQPWHWQGRIITPSGKLKWIEGASRPEKQANGDILWDGLVMDITDRKQAEERLRQSEARYKAILDAIPDLVFRISRDGEYLDFKGGGAIATIPREDIVGKKMPELLPPDVASMSLEAIATTLATGTLQTCEYQLPTSLGIRYYEARLVVSGQDEVLAIVRDITERKQGELALRESEEKFSKAFHCSPAPITISTLAEGRFIDVNESFLKLSGYSREEVIGHTAFELNVWANPSDRAVLLQQLQEGRAVRNLEFAFRSKSDQTMVTLLSAEVIYLDSIPCVLIANNDITERKKGELALRESEEKFSKAFRSSPNPITILTLKDGRYVDVNDTFLEITGFRREEVIGRSRSELNIWVNPADQVNIQQMLQEQGFVRNLETEFYTKTGEPRVVLFSAEIIQLGGEPCMLCVTNDITERKQAEAQLHLTAQRDRLLTQTLSRIRCSLNLDQILHTTVNEVRQFLQADRVFFSQFDENGQGRIVAESVDASYPSIRLWVTDNVAYQEITAMFAKHRLMVVNDTNQVEKTALLDKYHTTYQVKAGIAVPIILGGRLFGLLVANQCCGTREWQSFEVELLEQLTAQLAIAIQQAQLYQELAQLNTNLERQVQQRTAQLQQKMQELQELNRVKDVVLHTVSHDLKTSVMGTLMVLKNLHSQSGEKVALPRSIVERMIQGNDRQLAMINSLLEIHSSEAQGVVLHRELVQFHTLIEAITKDLEPMLASNQATVTNLVSPDLPLVMADPAQLQRVFDNFFTYSLKRNPPKLKFTLKATVEAGMIRCTIEDDGVGMSKLECDRLFELYVRDPQARSSTGIGLKMYLCRQIIRASGGEIGVSSKPKHGTLFWFTLPLATPSTQF